MKNLAKNIIYLLKNRFVILFLFLIIFIVTYNISFGSFFPSTETKNLWFYSGLFMVCFSILFIEPYYSSPKNVITNIIPLLLVFLAIKNSFHNPVFWWAAVTLFVLLLLLSISAIAIEDKDKSSDCKRNMIAIFMKNFVVLIGRGKILYSAVFIYFLLTYYSIQDFYTLFLFIFWFIILLIDPKEIHNSFRIKFIKKSEDQIGEIFGVQSNKIFLVKLYKDRKSISKFDIVKFRYSMQDADGLIITGMIFDTYLLNQEKWAKVLQLKDPEKEDFKLEKNIVYKLTDKLKIGSVYRNQKINNFVGVIIKGSNVGKIKFEYSKKKDDLQEGDLLELKVGDKRLFYQVINGITEKEKLEARNETGFINGEAIQLGEWRNDKLSFQKFGWVPSINTLVFKASTSDLKVNNFVYPYYKIGVIPGTNLPSVINLDEAISHHTALIGVTGCGKSFLTRKIVNEIIVDTKVICIDFTGEWRKKIDTAEYQVITRENIEDYLSHENNKIALFELPELSNTTDVLKETQTFLEKVFNYAKRKYDEDHPVKISLILEEAHTITPETSFLGDMGDYSSNKALVNKMTQIALQGRKYGIGLLVIAQRTANVSKTVLTQCNTVICFQAFDETSFTFLGNYIGKDMVQALPNLKEYHAIVVGKAAKSNMPMIINLEQK